MGVIAGGAVGVGFGLLLLAAGNLDCERDCDVSPAKFALAIGGCGAVGALGGGLVGALVGTGIDALGSEAPGPRVRVHVLPRRRGIGASVSVRF